MEWRGTESDNHRGGTGTRRGNTDADHSEDPAGLPTPLPPVADNCDRSRSPAPPSGTAEERPRRAVPRPRGAGHRSKMPLVGHKGEPPLGSDSGNGLREQKQKASSVPLLERSNRSRRRKPRLAMLPQAASEPYLAKQLVLPENGGSNGKPPPALATTGKEPLRGTANPHRDVPDIDLSPWML